MKKPVSLPTKLARLATLLTTPLLLTGCASVIAAIAEDPKPLVTADPICKAAVRPICVAPNDAFTQRTAAAVVKNNEGILAACPQMRREFERKKCPTGTVKALPEEPRPVKPRPAEQIAREPSTS